MGNRFSNEALLTMYSSGNTTITRSAAQLMGAKPGNEKNALMITHLEGTSYVLEFATTAQQSKTFTWQQENCAHISPPEGFKGRMWRFCKWHLRQQVAQRHQVGDGVLRFSMAPLVDNKFSLTLINDHAPHHYDAPVSSEKKVFSNALVDCSPEANFKHRLAFSGERWKYGIE